MFCRPASRAPALIGAELTTPRKPHDDGARQDAQNDLRDDAGDEEPRTVAALGPEDQPVHQETDDAGKKDHERVDHALNEGPG